jgi:hypothetical protein
MRNVWNLFHFDFANKVIDRGTDQLINWFSYMVKQEELAESIKISTIKKGVRIEPSTIALTFWFLQFAESKNGTLGSQFIF